MNKSIAAIAAAAMLIATQAPAFATDYGRHVKPVAGTAGKPTFNLRKGDKGFGLGLAVGVGVGLIGVAIAHKARAHQASHDRSASSYQTRYLVNQPSGGMCRVWRADCRNGIDSGCFKYERHC